MCTVYTNSMQSRRYAPVDVVVHHRVAGNGFLTLWWVIKSSQLVDNVLIVRRPQSDVFAAHILRERGDSASFHATVLDTSNALVSVSFSSFSVLL